MINSALASAIFALIPWALIARFVAQTSPGGDTNTTTLVTLVAQIGLSAIFLWQWRDERRERRELQATMVATFQSFLPALEASTQTLERVQEVMIQQVERATAGQAPPPIPTPPAANQPAVDEIMRRLEELNRKVDEWPKGGEA